VLRQGVQGISDLIAVPAMVNLDFADVRTIMRERGLAHMGIGFSTGEKRAVEAARQAVVSPLLETTINGAKGVLLNITGGSDLGIHEVSEAADIIREYADPEANIIWGAGIDEEIGEGVRITVIATGFDSNDSNVYNNQNYTQNYNSVNNVQQTQRNTVGANKPPITLNDELWRGANRRRNDYQAVMPADEEVKPHITMEDLPKMEKNEKTNYKNNNLKVPSFLRNND